MDGEKKPLQTRRFISVPGEGSANKKRWWTLPGGKVRKNQRERGVAVLVMEGQLPLDVCIEECVCHMHKADSRIPEIIIIS